MVRLPHCLYPVSFLMVVSTAYTLENKPRWCSMYFFLEPKAPEDSKSITFFDLCYECTQVYNCYMLKRSKTGMITHAEIFRTPLGYQFLARYHFALRGNHHSQSDLLYWNNYWFGGKLAAKPSRRFCFCNLNCFYCCHLRSVSNKSFAGSQHRHSHRTSLLHSAPTSTRLGRTLRTFHRTCTWRVSHFFFQQVRSCCRHHLVAAVWMRK